jgi:hypothetical protein
MEVKIRHDHPGGRYLRLEAEALDVAVFLGNVLGFSLDVEQHRVTAVHQRTGAKLTASGTSLTDASKKLIDLLTNHATSG